MSGLNHRDAAADAGPEARRDRWRRLRRRPRDGQAGPGTSGGSAGTDVAEGFRLPALVWVGYGAALLVIAAVGASSYWLDAARDGTRDAFWPFLLDELTSVVVVFALTPPLVAWTARLDPRRIGWVQTTLGHVAGLTAFCAAHVAGMVLLRRLAYALLGYPYIGDSVPMRLLYEGRKDALTYVGLTSGAWLLAALFTRRMNVAAPAAETRLEIRDGARRTWIDPADVLWVEAAGNYVELHLPDRSLLRRQTLSALERELEGRGFVRIHRSRLVNRQHVREIINNNSGDPTVILTDGRQISGSRRARERLHPPS